METGPSARSPIVSYELFMDITPDFSARASDPESFNDHRIGIQDEPP